MKVRIHPLVQRDISQAVRFYDGISDHLGTGFWQAFEETCARISSHPQRFHFAPCGRRRANFQRFPYHLLFIEELDGVYIVVARHHRRHPRYGAHRR